MGGTWHGLFFENRNLRILSTNIVKRLYSNVSVKIVTQEVMDPCFRFRATGARRIYGGCKVVFRFIFIPITRV